MKTKKTAYLLLILFIATPFFTTSCFRKGKDDPFISMCTRKDRVVGKWEISSRIDTAHYSINDTPSESVFTTIDGLSWTEVHKSDGVDDKTYKGKVVYGFNTYTFTKDGKFEYIFKCEYDKEVGSEEDDNLEEFKVEVEKRASGTWNFLSKIDSYKNKERIALVIEDRSSNQSTYKKEENEDDSQIPVLIDKVSSNEKFANGEMSTIWKIIMLKRKEIVLHQDIDKWHIQSENAIGGSTRISGNTSITLKKLKK